MRNSLYSITIEEALTQIKGTNAYQRLLLCSTYSLWLLCLSVYTFAYLQLPTFSFRLLNLGMLLGSPSMALLSNYCGRKPITYISSIVVSLHLGLWVIFPDHLDLFLMPLGGFLGSLIPTSFLLLIEVVQAELRVRYTCLLFSTFGISISISALVYLYVPFKLFLLAVMFLLLCQSLIIILKAKESPRYLAAVCGKYSQARWTLNAIGEMNGGLSFRDILEGEKVVGNQEIETERTPPTSTHARKHSFVQISESVVTITTTKLSTVKRHNLFQVWKFKQCRTVLPLLVFIGVLISSAKFTIDDLLPGVKEKIALGLIITGLFLPLYTLIFQTNRQIFLLVALGVSSICSVLGIVFEAKRCSDGAVCMCFDIICLVLFSITNAAVIGCLMATYLITVECLHSTVRSIGVFYIEFAMKLGVILKSFLTNDNVYVVLIFVIMTMSVLCFILLCFLSEECNTEMEDYMDEDREEMNRPLEISHMNVSCNQA